MEFYYTRLQKNHPDLISDLGMYTLDVFRLDWDDNGASLLHFNTYGGEQTIEGEAEIAQALQGSQLITEKLGNTLLSPKNRENLILGINEGRDVTINWLENQGIVIHQEENTPQSDEVDEEEVPF